MANNKPPRIVKSQRPNKETLFVRIPTPRGEDVADAVESMFIPATQCIGKKLEDFKITKPLMAAFVWAHKDVMSYAVRQISKGQQANFRATELKVPHPVLTRLVKKSGSLTGLDASSLVVEVEGVGEYPVIMKRDENNSLTLEMADGSDDEVWDVGGNSVKVSLFMKSPVVNRVLAVAWDGYPEKPNSKASVLRVASKALNSIRDLPDFRILSEVDSVRIPGLPGSGAKKAKKAEKAEFSVLTHLWSSPANEGDAPSHVGTGQVAIEVDLETATLTTSSLNLLITPSEELAESFEPYRKAVKDAISEKISEDLGAEHIRMIKTEIIVGEVNPGTIETLKDLGSKFSKMDVIPEQAVISFE